MISYASFSTGTVISCDTLQLRYIGSAFVFLEPHLLSLGVSLFSPDRPSNYLLATLQRKSYVCIAKKSS